jgi:hypothetical protein
VRRELRSASLVRVFNRFSELLRPLSLAVLAADGAGDGGRPEDGNRSAISGVERSNRSFSRTNSFRKGSRLKKIGDVSSAEVVPTSGGAELRTEAPWADAMGVGIWVGGCGKSRQWLLSSTFCLG